ncbi:MAG: response regulator [Halobacteriales archaeon]
MTTTESANEPVAEPTSHDVSERRLEEDPIDVLAVDDDADLVDLTATFLEREQQGFRVETATSVDDALELLEERAFEAIVSDYDMPEIDGLEFLELVRGDYPNLPFILFTGKGSEQIASKAIKKGVTDYLQKGTKSSQYSVLANRLHNAVQQYRTEIALQKSEAKFSKLVEHSTDVIAIINESARFEYLSPSARHILGYDPGELEGENVFDYAHPDDRPEAMEKFYSIIENPDTMPNVEFRFKDPDRNWPVLEARAKNLLDDDVIQGFVVNTRDITTAKERENELKRQKNQLENMKKSVMHDLRGPLNVAFGSLELYQESGDPEQMAKLERALHRVDQIIDQMVNLSSQGEEITETVLVRLEDVARKAWDMVETANATLQIEDSKQFQADPSRLQQLFENLFRNAVEHGGPDVTITVRTTDNGIIVADDGQPIPRENREEIFDPGFSTNGNLGYGLAIVKQIALGHGWEVDVGESDAGGTRFELSDITFEPTIYT